MFQKDSLVGDWFSGSVTLARFKTEVEVRTTLKVAYFSYWVVIARLSWPHEVLLVLGIRLERLRHSKSDLIHDFRTNFRFMHPPTQNFAKQADNWIMQNTMNPLIGILINLSKYGLLCSLVLQILFVHLNHCFVASDISLHLSKLQLIFLS